MVKIFGLFVAAMMLVVSGVVAAGGNFAGVAVTPGATVRASVPLSPQERQYVSEGGNAAPDHAVAVLAVPPNFNPQRQPILVCLSTSDFQRKNRDDLEDVYKKAAFAEGWAVIAGDGENNPGHDTAGWRGGMTLAALDALHRSFPNSKNWPMAVAGFSGGAKRTGHLAPLLYLAGNRLVGIFLAGVNEDRLTEGYRAFHPDAAFLRTPVYISSGLEDRVATPTQSGAVLQSLRNTGFSRTQLGHHSYGHAVSHTLVQEALRWFLQSQ